MYRYRTNSQLKQMARKQLRGKLSLFIAVIFFQYFFLVASESAVSSLFIGNATTSVILQYIVLAVIVTFTGLFETGTALLCLKASCNMDCRMSDFFFAFKHNPDKSLIVKFMLLAIKLVCIAPAIYSFYMIYLKTDFFTEYTQMLQKFLNDPPSDFSSMLTIEMETLEPYIDILTSNMKLLFLGLLISFLISIIFAPIYFMIVDFPTCTVMELLTKSVNIMKNHYFRYLGLIVSFIPLLILGILPYGIGLLFVIPYMDLAKANFYLEIMSVNNKEQNQTI